MNSDTLACIVTPTTNPEFGQKALDLAKSTAGVDCLTAMAIDSRHDGGCRTANQVLRKAYDLNTPFIAYINDDVEIRQQDWLARLIEVLSGRVENGIAAPGCRCGTRPQTLGRPGMAKCVRSVERLSFVTAVFKRAVFSQIGFLDEGYYHWACDTDFCERARKAGWRLLYVQDVFVLHNHIPWTSRAEHVQKWKALDLARWKARKR